jgi:hypothetical protein
MNEQLALALWIGCAHRERRTRDMALASVGRIALCVGAPLKSMSREMVFLRSGLELGVIAPWRTGNLPLEEG